MTSKPKRKKKKIEAETYELEQHYGSSLFLAQLVRVFSFPHMFYKIPTSAIGLMTKNRLFRGNPAEGQSKVFLQPIFPIHFLPAV